MRFKIASDRPRWALAWADTETETITLTPELLRRWNTQPDAFWRSVRHEVAHLQTPKAGHMGAWRTRSNVLNAGGRTFAEAAPARLGRPSKVSPELADRARALRAEGLSWSTIALATGLARSTIRRLCRNVKHSGTGGPP